MSIKEVSGVKRNIVNLLSQDPRVQAIYNRDLLLRDLD